MYKLLTKLSSILVTTFLSAGLLTAAEKTITIGMQLEPPNLNPTGGAAAAIDEIVYANLFEGLTRYTSEGSIAPALAKSWDISSDGKSYTFHLQKNVLFHDGTVMDASDVKFSLNRARGDESTNAQKALFIGISDIDIIDQHTVKVNLTAPNGSFITNMAWGDAVIVAKESIDLAETKPVGTGPFKFSNG